MNPKFSLSLAHKLVGSSKCVLSHPTKLICQLNYWQQCFRLSHYIRRTCQRHRVHTDWRTDPRRMGISYQEDERPHVCRIQPRGLQSRERHRRGEIQSQDCCCGDYGSCYWLRSANGLSLFKLHLDDMISSLHQPNSYRHQSEIVIVSESTDLTNANQKKIASCWTLLLAIYPFVFSDVENERAPTTTRWLFT